MPSVGPGTGYKDDQLLCSSGSSHTTLIHTAQGMQGRGDSVSGKLRGQVEEGEKGWNHQGNLEAKVNEQLSYTW